MVKEPSYSVLVCPEWWLRGLWRILAWMEDARWAGNPHRVWWCMSCCLFTRLHDTCLKTTLIVVPFVPCVACCACTDSICVALVLTVLRVMFRCKHRSLILSRACSLYGYKTTGTYCNAHVAFGHGSTRFSSTKWNLVERSPWSDVRGLTEPAWAGAVLAQHRSGFWTCTLCS